MDQETKNKIRAAEKRISAAGGSVLGTGGNIGKEVIFCTGKNDEIIDNIRQVMTAEGWHVLSDINGDYSGLAIYLHPPSAEDKERLDAQEKLFQRAVQAEGENSKSARKADTKRSEFFFIIFLAYLVLMYLSKGNAELKPSVELITKTGVFATVIFISYTLMKELIMIFRSSQWVKTPGVIQTSWIYEGRHASYIPKITYIFQVSGIAYHGKNVRIPSWLYKRTQQYAQTCCAENPEGATVDVFYDPVYPKYNALQRPKQNVTSFLTTLLGVLATILLTFGLLPGFVKTVQTSYSDFFTHQESR